MAAPPQLAPSPRFIGDGLNAFRDDHASNYERLEGEELKDVLIDLIIALQGLPGSRRLPSARGGTNLLEDLSNLMTAVINNNFEIDRILPLLRAVLCGESDGAIWDRVYEVVTERTPPPRPTSSFRQTPHSINSGSFANSTERRKHVDDVLKQELGQLFVDIPDFFKARFEDVPNLGLVAQAVFDKCKEGENPLYQEESGWSDWPEKAKEEDVLSWFTPLPDQFMTLAGEHWPSTGRRRRILAQPHHPLEGSRAARKLDIGFVDDAKAAVGTKCHWSHILVPGELKSNPSGDKASQARLDLGRYAREVLAAQDNRRFVVGFTLCGSWMRMWEFDRLGGIASEQFDINQDGLRFVSVVLGLLWMNDEQLGFDPTIVVDGDKRYIEIERNGGRERLIIDCLMKRVRCINGRATTCWKVHQEGHPGIPLVVKDSWQYTEREEEGELLREATEKGVTNVAKYYHHETVRVGDQDDDVHKNVRKGLDITKATNYKPEVLMPPRSTTGRQDTREDGSSAARRKRSSSNTEIPSPPCKRTYSSLQTRSLSNRIHRRVIVKDCGKPIYEASSLASLLTALEGCIEGYQSLQTKAGMLQCDVSPNNLMMNEDDDNPSQAAFMIDLDLAVKQERETSSGAPGKTGTRAFMAIGVLLDLERHSFMHDLESFFWVLFWICIHYDRPASESKETAYEKWNFMDMQDLATTKLGVVSVETLFINRITDDFTEYYKPLIPCVRRLRGVVFPGGKNWKTENTTLYSQMKGILREARSDLQSKSASCS